MGGGSVGKGMREAERTGDSLKRVQVALLSAYHKEGLVEFARGLERLGVRILSSGGSAGAIEKAGVPVEEIAAYTGSPEMLGGRVKTLHPKVHAGILARRDRPEEMAELEARGSVPIDLVAVDPYPFGEIAASSATEAGAAEGIDVGGPALLRAAAKNLEFVVVVAGRDRYAEVLRVLEEGGGGSTLDSRRRWAAEAFRVCSLYDAEIAAFLDRKAGGEFPVRLGINFHRVGLLRYGENPHQLAALYREPSVPSGRVARARQLQGKPLSFNNVVDLDAALRVVSSFEEPAAAIIKHANPCGVAVAVSLHEAFLKARRTDEMSAFGGIVALNRPLDRETAAAVAEFFVEAVAAPSVDHAAREVLVKKKKLILVEVGRPSPEPPKSVEVRSIWGGIVAQEWDRNGFSWDGVRVVTQRQPTDEEVSKLTFAWRVVGLVRSNAIVLAEADRTVGIGAGQMSRVDSVDLAIRKAESSGIETTGAGLASDGFFPFADSLERASAAGVRAVIQPGGSIRDRDVIDKADELGMTMVFTGRRHFKH